MKVNLEKFQNLILQRLTRGDMKEKRRFYEKIFESADPAERDLIDRLIDEVVYLEETMDEMKQLPFVAVNPKNTAMQRRTPAAAVYKDCMSQYQNAIRILLNVIRKTEPSAADELMKRLEDFM